MKKILYISANPYSDVSMGVITRYLANVWSSQYEVDILALGDKSHDVELNDKINVIPIPGFWGDKQSQDTINKYLMQVKDKYDFIFAHGDGWYYNNIDLPLGKTKNILYLNVEGDFFPERHWQIKKWDKIIFPLPFAREAVTNTFPQLNQTDVITHFVDEKIFKIDRSEKMDQLKQNKLSPLILGYVGVNSGRKNLYTLLQAVAELKDKNMELWLVTLNSTPDGINLQECAAQFGISSRIRVFPRLTESELVKFYNSIDVYVSTSLSEAFGIPIIEAQACGVPVIASNIAAHRAIIKSNGKLVKTVANVSPNSSGMVLKFSDINQLKSCISDHIKHQTEIANNKQIIRESISNYFWSNVKDKWLHVFDDVKSNAVVRNLIATKYRSHFVMGASNRNNNFIAYRSHIKEIKSKFNHNKKFLCIFKDGNLGDIIATLPLLQKLKSQYPFYITCFLGQSNQLSPLAFSELQKTVLDKFYDFSLLLDQEFINYDIQLHDLFDIFIVDRYLCKDLNGKLEQSDYFKKYENYYNGFVSSNSHLSAIGDNVIDLGLKSFNFDNNDIDIYKIANKFKSGDLPILKDKPFIFMDNVSGFSPSKQLNNSVYRELQNKLLDKYKDYYIVQSIQNFKQDNDSEKRIISLPLNIEVLTYCLRNSKLNITIENGLSWLAYLLGLSKKTIVLFSNTSDVVFNLNCKNLTIKKCYPCWWSTFNWNRECLLKEKQCLNIVSNSQIMKEVENAIK